MNDMNDMNNFTKEIELDPKFVKAYYGRGITYVENGNISLAQKDLKELKVNKLAVDKFASELEK